jgi:hypothetical protein
MIAVVSREDDELSGALSETTTISSYARPCVPAATCLPSMAVVEVSRSISRIRAHSLHAHRFDK